MAYQRWRLAASRARHIIGQRSYEATLSWPCAGSGKTFVACDHRASSSGIIFWHHHTAACLMKLIGESINRAIIIAAFKAVLAGGR